MDLDFEDTRGYKSQNRFILTNIEWGNAVRKIEAYCNYCIVPTNYRVLTTRVTLSF